MATEEETLQLWFAAYEPAVAVNVSESEVVMRSTRPNRPAVVRRPRHTTDLVTDLSAALGQLVLETS